MKTTSFEEIKDMVIGKLGTPGRDHFEEKVRSDALGYLIKQTRMQRKLTQEELANRVGLEKAQISKLESSANNATIGTILKVFRALEADIQFNVTLEDQHLQPA